MKRALLQEFLSKTIEIRFVLLLLRDEFRHSDQDQTRSVLDRIRHDQGFPNSSRKMACWGWIFRDEFGKSGQDQTRSGLPKFVTENGLLRVDFPWRIWETLIVSDPVQLWWMAFSKAPLAPSIPFTDQLHNVIGGVVSSHSRQDQTWSGFPKFVTENGWLRVEIWTRSDVIRVSQICYGKWPAEGGFSETNLGNLDRIRHDQGWLAEGDFP